MRKQRRFISTKNRLTTYLTDEEKMAFDSFANDHELSFSHAATLLIGNALVRLGYLPDTIEIKMTKLFETDQ